MLGLFKVIDTGTNGKPACDYLLAVNSNLGHILYHFQDIEMKTLKTAILLILVSLKASLGLMPHELSYEIWFQKLQS